MATTLGKRKDREEKSEEQGHGSTLFVSNLPYTATSTDLKTLFSDIAPVRSAFVVLEHETGVSKGVGYVSFAIKEDAAAAVESFSKEAITLEGRTLRVQWAENRSKDHETRPEKSKDEKKKKNPPPRPPRNPTASDPLAIRTVVISGLPASVDSKTLWKKVRKVEGAEKVDWPVKSASGEEDPTTAHAVFGTPAAASEGVKKLHAHVFKGSLLSATLKKRLDGLATAVKKGKAPAKTPEKVATVTPNRASRLIVRNLPWDITEQDLRAMFLPYGPIHSIHIPVSIEQPKEDGDGDGDVKMEDDAKKPRARTRAKGFAFVWMLSRKDAENAMEGCNGRAIEPGLAESLMLDKQKKKKQRREEKKQKAAAGAGEDEEAAEDGSEQKPTSSRRIIAVDFALSKDKWEAEKAKMEVDNRAAEDEDGSDEEDDDGSESDAESSSGSQDQLGVHDGSEGGSDESGSEDEDDDDDQKPVKPTLPPPETGTTLFVRNVPFEATEDELRTLFRAFGPLRYARITMDAATGRSRGTGFVCFWNKDDADKAVEQSNILRAETGGNELSTTKKNPFKMPSLLTPDPSASIAQNLVLHGRTLDVNRAVTRDEASKLKEAGERQREKADKRNLYLLREGIIMPNTPAAETLTATEVEKRTQSFNARRALLRSNPSLYVSRTRLSVRQLPLFVTERMLKRLAIHAVRAFEADVKRRTRSALTEDELAEPVVEDAEGDKVKEEEPAKKAKGKKGGRDTGVKQAKIVRQQDRVDPVTGKGRSRGYAFLEMTTHADALRVLRWANNNAEVGPLFEEWWKSELEALIKAEKKKEQKDEQRIKRIREDLEKGVPPKSKGTLIVEFSIENVQVVQRRAAHQKDQKAAPGGKPSKRQRSEPKVKVEDSDGRPEKKRKVSEPPKSPAKSTAAAEKPATDKGNKMGSLIGRKRKERKMKKGRS